MVKKFIAPGVWEEVPDQSTLGRKSNRCPECNRTTQRLSCRGPVLEVVAGVLADVRGGKVSKVDYLGACAVIQRFSIRLD